MYAFHLHLIMSLADSVALRAALLQLGISDVYHMAVPFEENPPDVGLWVEAIDAKYKGVGKQYGKEEWDSLLGEFMVRYGVL